MAEVAGEPRVLHLYLDPKRRKRAAATGCRRALARPPRATAPGWRRGREAIDAGWFGPSVDPAVAPRIGDVLVAARKRIAYYDGRDPQRTGRNMIGQHGSLTPEETRVPLLRFGAAG